MALEACVFIVILKREDYKSNVSLKSNSLTHELNALNYLGEQ